MSQKTAAIDQAVKFSKKCPECGLRNFPDAERCRRCDSELSRGSTGTREFRHVRIESGAPAQPRVRSLLILATSLVVLFAVVMFYVRRDLQGAIAALREAVVAQPSTAEVEISGEDPAYQDARSLKSAGRILAELKRFRVTTQNSMTYDEYDEMLVHLEADLNSTLPAFARHEPDDENFRQEVAAALRDYTAARNWWKTTLRNSRVLNDNDRVARLQEEWSSARTHLDNAEKLLLH